ncbi:uncharacterized protein LOC135466802 isoform X2 [Liolophura sinensis]
MGEPVTMYGGMLAWQLGNVTLNDSDIKHLVKVALDFLKSQREQTERRSTDLYKEHKITDLKKYRLVYSEDDSTPLSVSVVELTSDGETRRGEGLAYMGFLYKFTLTLGIERHRFEMSEFTTGQTHIYSHIPDVQMADQPSCVSQSGSSKAGATDGDSDEPACEKVCSDKLTLKVLSQNIWNFFNVEHTEEDYVRRMKILGPVLQSAAADIIGLQEVRYQHGSGLELGPSQMSHLYHYLPDYQFIFQPAMTQGRSIKKGRCEEGLAIFSRFPILNYDYLLLNRNKSDPTDGHQRICLHAEIAVPSFGKVHVFVSHLSLSDSARQKSVVQIREYMLQFDGPAFLLGDLNAEPQEDSIRYLSGQAELQNSRVSDLLDTWLVSNEEGPSGLTFSSLEKKPDRRIDYIFMRKSGDITVDEINLIGSGKYGSGAASDHYGVLATFRTSDD